MSSLHVYRLDSDWWVASTAEDAWRVREKHSGERREDAADGAEMTLVPDDKKIRILCEQRGGRWQPSDTGKFITKTAAEWAAQEGRGMLCSTEI